MLPYFWYLLKVIICSGILFGYYWLFLRNKLFHQYNRFYLLSAMGLSLLLPLLKINFWQQSAETNGAIRVLRAVSVGDEYMDTVVISTQRNFWNFESLYPLVYCLVSLVFVLVLIRTLYLIRTLLKRYPVQQIEEITFVNTDDDSTPFSFLKYIFWNSSIDMSTVTGRQIFKHEVAHIQEKHTYDKLFVNVLLIFCWCNPFFWLYRKELNMIHEFIADKKAVADGNTTAFANMILQATYPKHRFELTNNFFYSPIKRRLRMLTKIDNPRVSYFTRLMVLPLAVLVFAAFTFKAKTNASLYHGKKITVVIDAGHGGDRDAGGRSADGIMEKDLTLAIAKKVKELNSNSDIEIILTRNEDIYMSPTQKADFAKSKNADLLISFHVDNGPKESANTRSGIALWVAKDEYPNTEKSKILASAIVNEFNNNYALPVIREINQRKMGIWILQESNCPSVLIETGFINNDKDVEYLKTKEAKETIARNVLAGIEKYLTGKQLNSFSINNSDTVPITAPSDLAALASKKEADTFDYYKKYGNATDYKGQKIKSVFIRDSDSKAIIEFVSGNLLVMTQEDVFKAKILSAPPPPPPPPPGFYPNDVRPDSFMNKTLIVVDGIIKSDNYIMDNNNIKSVNVLKGNSAITKYGERGKFGVVEITTKNRKLLVENDKADPENALYVLNGKILGKGKAAATLASDLNAKKVYVKWLNKSEATAKYGKQGAEGACETTFTDEREINNSIDNNPNEVSSSQEAKIFLGKFRGGRISIEDLKAQKEIRVSQGYSFESAAVYFQGPGFDNVVMATLYSSSLSTLTKYIDMCTQGSSLIFDNVYVKDNAGNRKLVMMPPGFSVFDNTKMTATDEAITNAINKEKLNQRNVDDKIFTIAEVPPQFIGGQQGWRDFLRKNLNASIPVDSGASAGKLLVIVKFIIHTDGSVSDISCEKDPGYGTCEEVKRIIRESSKKWEPAVQNGRKVNAYHKQPVTFLVED